MQAPEQPLHAAMAAAPPAALAAAEVGTGTAAIVGRLAVVDALRQHLLSLGLADAPRHLLLRDDDRFGFWPLDEPTVLDTLSRWLREPGRQLTLLGRDFAAMATHHPRFARWRRDWVHRVAAWQPAEPDTALNGLLLEPQRAVQLLDPVHWRGRRVDDPRLLRALREQCDAQLQRSEPAWPSTTLGL